MVTVGFFDIDLYPARQNDSRLCNELAHPFDAAGQGLGYLLMRLEQHPQLQIRGFTRAKHTQQEFKQLGGCAHPVDSSSVVIGTFLPRAWIDLTQSQVEGRQHHCHLRRIELFNEVPVSPDRASKGAQDAFRDVSHEA